ncbi:hypothetical protein DFS33DRAFT_1280958 [Desarmillaria ectypa]|nr:hypothetical protein DFS33DRAFT_1280958 [Desarmillaria ectypa]
MWGMARIRKSALRKLTKSEPLDAVERVVYGRELAVAEWAISGLHDLVARQTAISKEESARLGADTSSIRPVFHRGLAPSTRGAIVKLISN